MTIIDIPTDQAARLLPLLHQVHALHVRHQPARYAELPTDAILLPWLSQWLQGPDVFCIGVTAPDDDLMGYAIYEIELRPAIPLRAAETRAMLHQISVDAQCRKQGVGSRLLTALKTRMPDHGATVLGTTYATFNDASERLMARASLTPALIYAEHRLS